MQLQVSGHQIDVTPALRDHVQAKLDRLARHFDNITSLAVVLSVEKQKLKQCAEGTLSVAGCTLHAEASGTDMYASIDTMFGKLDAQLRKHKTKQTDHHRSEAREARTG